MELTIKNIAIILIFLFLISSQLIGIFWGIIKASLYLILFLLIVNKISPELYKYLVNIFKFDKIKLENIPGTLIKIIRKIIELVRDMIKLGSKNRNLIIDEILSDKIVPEENYK